MIEKTYSYSCLNGFSGVHETIACPKRGTLSGRTIEWIEYLDLHSNLVMDGSIGIVGSRILSIALPIIALLDFLIAPGKALYFAATHQNKRAVEELRNAVHHLALAIFSVISIPYALYNPTSVYLSEDTWTKIKQKHLKEELLTTFATLRKTNPIDSDAHILSQAVYETLPKVFEGENPEEPFIEIIDTIFEQFPINKKPKDYKETTILLDHFQHWISVFLVGCHREKLQIDGLDDTFYHLICETIRLKNPTLREQMTNRIIADYAKDSPVVRKFQQYLTDFEEDRQEKVLNYLEEQRQTKARERSRAEERIKRMRASLKAQEEAKKPNKQAIAGIKESISQLEEKLPLTGVVDDQFLQEKKGRADEIYPPFSPTKHTYLSLYFALSISDYSENLFNVLHAPVFKDCHQRHFLLNFLLLLEENIQNLDVQDLIEKMQQAYDADLALKDRKYPNLIQFLKNCTILIQLNEWSRMRSDEILLHSPGIIPELFKSRFQLEAYNVEGGDDLFLKEYEETFAKFRDPTTIMILYSTLSLLQKEERESALAGLTEFVKHTLSGEDDLHQYRHDTEKSEHLTTCYELKPGLKEKWESTNTFVPLSDEPRYNGYIIGEATSAKDLIMCSQEVIKSCLHPSGRPQKVKGYLAILLDGKIHPVVIKTPDGKIVARMLTKQILPEDDQPPVLMIDTVYSSSHDSDEIKFFTKKIMDYCHARAKELDELLVSFESKDSSSGDDIGSVHSLPSGVHFEHVNAFEGVNLAKKVVFENGEYTIPKAYLVEPLIPA